jgi:hypothetical protein
MSIFNRRNAVVGWLSWLVAKRVVKRKAKNALPGTVEGSRRPNRAAFFAGLAAVGGAVLFWRRRGGEQADDAGPPATGE